MSTNTMTVKIALRNKTDVEWQESAAAAYVPLKGELCLERVTTAVSGVTAVGDIRAKLGDGVTEYSALSYIYLTQTQIAALISSGSVSKAAQLTTARYIDGVSFNGTANIQHFATCSTAAATAAKTVSVTGFSLISGAIVTVKFTNGNSVASPTLNVNSLGAKALMYRGSAITAALIPKANAVYTFVYNGTNFDLIGDIDTDTDTVYTGESPISVSGTTIKHATSGAAAETYGQVTVNTYGHVTSGTVIADVSHGGTGASSFTSGTALIGNGTSAIQTRTIATTVPTDSNSTSTDLITAGAVAKAIGNVLSANDAMVFKGTIGPANNSSGTAYSTVPTVTSLPTTYSAGWTYRVINESATYAGNTCEVGDLIIAVKDGTNVTTVQNSDWTVVNTNITAVNGDSWIGTSYSGGTIKVTHKGSSPTTTDDATVKPAHGGTFTAVKSITSDATGHVTAITTETVTLPADNNTHYTTMTYVGDASSKANAVATSPYLKVFDDSALRSKHQISGSGTVTVTSDANGNITITGKDTNTHAKSYNITAASSTATTQSTTASTTNAVYINHIESAESANPTSNHKIYGSNTTTVNLDADGSIKIIGAAAGSGLSSSGNTINHASSVTAGTVSDGGSARTLGWGGTFNIPSITYNATGHITGTSTLKITMPANPNTDTGATSGSITGYVTATGSYNSSTRALTFNVTNVNAMGITVSDSDTLILDGNTIIA